MIKKLTNMKEGTHKVWVRVGGYIELTDHDIDILQNDKVPMQTKADRLDRIIFATLSVDGECNIPCEVNDCIDDDIDITI